MEYSESIEFTTNTPTRVFQKLKNFETVSKHGQKSLIHFLKSLSGQQMNQTICESIIYPLINQQVNTR